MGNSLSLQQRLERAQKTGIVTLPNAQLKKIPSDLFDPSVSDKIKNLDLTGNKLKEIPAKLSSTHLPNLKTLFLSSNKISALPPHFFTLASLENLSLSQNRLSAIPSSIHLLVNLKSLNLSNNSLTSLPIELGSIKSLVKLDISSNALTSLPVTFGGLMNLEELVLDQNNLNEDGLPDTLELCGRLKALSVKNNNRLKKLPPKLLTGTPVSYLALEGTEIGQVQLEEMLGYKEFEKRRKGRVDQLL